jgi:hypothetical protein
MYHVGYQLVTLINSNTMINLCMVSTLFFLLTIISPITSSYYKPTFYLVLFK